MYIDKPYQKSCPIIYTYNNKKNKLILIHLPKILKVSQDIDFYLVTIIKDNDNENIMFYIQEIVQTYSLSCDSIVQVTRPLYGEPEADKHQLAIYYPYYKKKKNYLYWFINIIIYPSLLMMYIQVICHISDIKLFVFKNICNIKVKNQSFIIQ